MNQNSILEKYQYLRECDALADIQIGVLETDATTLEELAAYMPDIMCKLSDYHASLLPRMSQDLLVSVLKPKHRVAALAQSRMSKQLLNDLAKGMEEGRPVVSCFGGSTAELFPALGAMPLFMENVTANLAAAFEDGVEADLDESEEDGFPTHLCGMQRAPFAAFKHGKLPFPTAMVKMLAPCNSSNMLYQYVLDKYDIPLVAVDAPYRDKGERSFDYYFDEYMAMVEQLEGLLGTRLDEGILRKHVEFGNRQMSYLFKLQDLRKLKPNPDPGFFRCLDFGALFYCGINEETVEYMKVRYEDVKARVDIGESLVPEGKKEIRTLWTWGFIGIHPHMYDWAEEEFGSTYLEDAMSYIPQDVVGLVDTSSAQTMLRGLALRAYNLPMVRQVMGSSDVLVNDLVTIAGQYQADAAVFSGSQTCKHAWAAHKRISDALMDEFGIPSLTYETDQVDKRFTPHATTKALLSEFFSTFEE